MHHSDPRRRKKLMTSGNATLLLDHVQLRQLAEAVYVEGQKTLRFNYMARNDNATAKNARQLSELFAPDKVGFVVTPYYEKSAVGDEQIEQAFALVVVLLSVPAAGKDSAAEAYIRDVLDRRISSAVHAEPWPLDYGADCVGWRRRSRVLVAQAQRS